MYVKTLNKADKNIKLIRELENSSTLPYLGILIMKNNNKLETKIYEKPNVNTSIMSKSAKCSVNMKCLPLTHSQTVKCRNDPRVRF